MLDYCLSHPQILPVGLLLFALATTLLSLGRILPAQNVVSVTLIIGLLAGVMEWIGAKFGTPFGHFRYTAAAGPRIFNMLPWPIPLIWVVVVLNSRGLARLVLRPWRASPNIGLWVLGVACLLAVLFDAALELYASAQRYWIWQTPKIIPSWHGVPWTNFFGWAITSLLLLTLATPWLIDKKRPKDSPPDYFPAFAWMLLFLFLVVKDFA